MQLQTFLSVALCFSTRLWGPVSARALVGGDLETVHNGEIIPENCEFCENLQRDVLMEIVYNPHAEEEYASIVVRADSNLTPNQDDPEMTNTEPKGGVMTKDPEGNPT